MDIATLGLAVDSRPVTAAAKALDTLAAAGQRAEVVTHKVEASFDAEALAAATAKGAVAGLTAALVANSEAERKAEAERRAAEKAARDAASAQDELASAHRRTSVAIAAAVASAGLMVKRYIDVADAVTVLNNQLKLATGSTEAAAQASAGLYEIAQRSRVNFLELGGTYSSIARSAGEMGIAQNRVLKVTESIANAMTISGGSAASMNAALVQLGQGMASGTLRGDELNSVMEQAPRLAKALADGLGVPIGRLREMGAAGEITAQQVVKALESQSAVLAKEVASATMTVGQSFTQLTNASTRAIGEFDAASGSSAALAAALSAGAGAIDMLGTAFKNNQGTIQTVMGAIAGAAVLTTLGAIPGAFAAIGTAWTALSAILLANPVTLALLGIGAVAGGGAAAVNALAKTDSGIKDAIRSLQAENERSEAALARAVEGGRTAGADNIRKVIEDRKKAIRELNAELALRDNAGVSSPAEDARFAARTSAIKADEAASRELMGIRQKLYKVDADYLPTLQKLNQQYLDGRISLAAYRSDVEALAKANYKPATQAAGVGQNEVADLRAKLKEQTKYLEDLQTRGAAAQKTTSGESQVLKIQEELKTSITGVARAEKERALAVAEKLASVDRQIATEEAYQKAIKASEAALNSQIDAVAKQASSVRDQAAGQEAVNANFGKSKTAIEQTTLALYKQQFAEADSSDRFAPAYVAALQAKVDAQERFVKALEETEYKQEKLKLTDAGTAAKQETELLQLQISLIGKTQDVREQAIAQRKIEIKLAKELADIEKLNLGKGEEADARRAELRAQASANAQIESANAASKAVVDRWQSTADKIESEITGALMRGFESGKGVAENLRDTVVNIFKTMVLEPTIKAIVAPVGNTVSSVVMGALGINKPGTSMGGLPMGSTGIDLSSMFDVVGGWFGGGSAAAATGGSATKAALYSNTGYGSTSTAASGFQTAGNVLSYLNALDLWSKGQRGAAAGSAIGTYFGGPIGSFIGQTIGSKLDYKIDPRGGGLSATLGGGTGLTTGKVGQYAEYAQQGGWFGGGNTINRDWSVAGKDVTDYISNTTKATNEAVKQYAAALGLAPDAIAGFTKDIEISLTGLDASGQKAAIDAAIAKFADDMVSSAYGDALKGLAKEGESSGQTLQRLATTLTVVNADLNQLGLSMLPVGTASAVIASGLADAFGGVEAMQKSVGAYFDAMYTDAEKAAKSTASLDASFAALGLSVPANEAAFKKLVEGIDITTVEGQKLAANVINLAPAFSQASKAAQAAAASMLSAISNWGSSEDVRAFKAQQLQQTLAAGGLNLSMGDIMGATKESALAFYKSLDPNSAQAQALLKNQQAIFDFVSGGGSRGGDSSVAGSTGVAYTMNQALDNASSAWVDAANSIKTTMGELEQTLLKTGPDSFAKLQAKFAIDLARAQAHDLGAAKELPDLARSLVSAGNTFSKTALDQARLTAYVYNSLASVPSFDVGTDYVPHDMLAMVHEGERITPKAFNDGGGGDTANLADALRMVRAELADLRSELEKISENTKQSKFFAGKWDTIGMPPARATL